VAGPDSAIQIATFLDYRCPYCRKLADIMSKMHDDNVRIVYKEWPILGEASLLAARYALAADRQGKYLAFHLRVMSSRFIPTAASLEAIAAELGIDVPQLRADTNSGITTREIQRTAALAAALGFIGTPAMVVGRTIVQGEITRDQLQRLIEDERQPQPPKPCDG
jgi:protein-disulfide isomerase